MKVIITSNTAIKGKSIAANPNKVVDLSNEDALALISAQKARVATKEDGKKKPSKAEKEAAEKEAAEKAATEAAAKNPLGP